MTLFIGILHFWFLRKILLESFADTRTLFAKVEPKLGNEDFEAGRIENPITHLVYTRYYSDINFANGGGKMRISWNDSGTTRTLSVKSVIDVEFVILF